MTETEKRRRQKKNWAGLPENKPSWETWKRLLGYYHSEEHAWFMWEQSQKRKSKS